MNQPTSTDPGPRSGSSRRAAAVLLGWAVLPLVGLAVGCGIAPKHFRALTNPAPIVRARSVGLADGLPEARVVPPLIERLNDPDPVVRLTAHEELKRKTGQDFGYLPWASPEERAHAVGHWRSWWEGRKAALARSRPIH